VRIIESKRVLAVKKGRNSAVLGGPQRRLTRGPECAPARFAAFLLLLLAALPGWGAEKPRLHVDDYAIDATIAPSAHKLTARAQVKFTALEDTAIAVFELNNDLRLNRVTGASGQNLPAERVTQDSTVRVSLPAALAKGASATLIFDYAGVLQNADESPVQGLSLAKIDAETSYLLYAGRWFPVAGYGLNRFTATISITAPKGYVAVASGEESGGNPAALAAEPAAPALTRRRKGRPAEAPAPPAAESAAFTTSTYVWNKPGFPGSIVIGRFAPVQVNEGGLSLVVYFNAAHKDLIQTYAETATKEFQFFTLQFGLPMTNVLKLVELPNDTVDAAWAPEISALAGRVISDRVNYRLLANSIAHQWWGSDVSPARGDDWWLSDGFARYSEAMYVESVAGQGGLEQAIKDISVGALAYDTIPLSRVSTLEIFSPEFQSLVTDKGAMILHMLRWVIGDAAFSQTMRDFAKQYAGKPARAEDFQQLAEHDSGQQLTWFFTQWLDSTGAPAFKNKYTVYRTAKGFRVVGEIAQDLDLFRMPVEVRIETDGKTETKRLEVVGTNSPYSIETFGKPRRITIDPGGHLLVSSSDLKMRTNLLRGQQLVQQGELAGALQEFQKALDSNRNSSLAHYRIAEVFFLQRNYQAAANEYREALNGNGDPRWTEVWSHLQLGKIFDITGQRDRAVNEYRQAMQTNDNTQGAQDEARKYLQTPYAQEKTSS
jgi:tetratricopeptide (TPR) repeat protein